MEFWGHKTDSFLDVWSIEHLFMGIGIGSICFGISKFMNRDKPEQVVQSAFLLAFCLSFFWEMIEHYLETGLAGNVVQQWFAGVEHWSNRLISDHIMVLAGLLIYQSCQFLLWPARIFSLAWLYIHIFVFPDSMHLHSDEFLEVLKGYF